jgi:hypothetical protein
MDVRDIMIELGIKIPDLIAGFAGGVVSIFAFRRVKPIDVVGSMLAGALTANYCQELVAKLLFGTSPGVAGFVCGCVGMGFCQWITEAVRKRVETLGGQNGPGA